MTRPGPRPYECVRRAWHSDRDNFIRGSIIQKIFKVVNESHSAVTKKNKEWQEKLPIVVLKAEEILYSKANSEAEYIDLETLWDRVNDAIDTIIRRDGSTETGELLPPCVEATLNLGCVPKRASLRQRHSNPTTLFNFGNNICIQGVNEDSPGSSSTFPAIQSGHESESSVGNCPMFQRGDSLSQGDKKAQSDGSSDSDGRYIEVFTQILRRANYCNKQY